MKAIPPRPPSDKFPSDALWDLVLCCCRRASGDRPSASTLLAFLRPMAGLGAEHPFAVASPHPCQQNTIETKDAVSHSIQASHL